MTVRFVISGLGSQQSRPAAPHESSVQNELTQRRHAATKIADRFRAIGQGALIVVSRNDFVSYL